MQTALPVVGKRQAKRMNDFSSGGIRSEEAVVALFESLVLFPHISLISYTMKMVYRLIALSRYMIRVPTAISIYVLDNDV